MITKMNLAHVRQFVRNPLFIACCTMLAPAANAQLLEEVIVTAQKREQNLQDVPISVSAFSGALLQESAIKDVFDLQASAPGLTVDQNQNATTAISTAMTPADSGHSTVFSLPFWSK